VTTHRSTTRRGALAALLAAALALTTCVHAEDDPAWSELVQEPLHDLPLPAPGEIWIEFDGEVIYEGETHGTCGFDATPTEWLDYRNFVASANWLSADGQARFVTLERGISGEPMTWRRSGTGHEADLVRYMYRSDDELWRARELDFRDTLRSFASHFRVDPGGEVIREWGEAAFPFIRVAEDGLRATAVATLEARFDDDPDSLEGLMRIAVHCAGE